MSALIVELKHADWAEEPDVQAKAAAAARWCEYASQMAAGIDAKPWACVLIPHTGFGLQSSREQCTQALVAHTQIGTQLAQI